MFTVCWHLNWQVRNVCCVFPLGLRVKKIAFYSTLSRNKHRALDSKFFRNISWMTNIDDVNADWNLSSEKNPIFFVIWSPSDSSTKHLKISLFVGYEMLKLAKRSIRVAVLFCVIPEKRCIVQKWKTWFVFMFNIGNRLMLSFSLSRGNLSFFSRHQRV